MRQRLRQIIQAFFLRGGEGVKLKAILSALPGQIVIVNADGVVRETYTGANGPIVTQWRSSAFDLFDREFETKLRQAFMQLSTKPSIEFEHSLPGQDGHDQHLGCTISKCPEAGFVLYLTDKTEQVRLAEFLKHQEFQMLQHSRLVSLGEVASGIGHEINNPLAVITTVAAHMSRLNEKRELGPDQIARFTEKIQTTASRIAKIVRSLKSLSRDASQEELVPCRLGDVVQDAVDLCGDRFRKDGVDLHLKVDDQLLVLGRRVQLVQVLTNLLANALFEARKTPQGWVKVETHVSNGSVRLYVVDCGRGIKPEILARVFDPFFTTKATGEGTGLGMSISRQILTAHSGRLDYELVDGHTAFFFELKLARAESTGLAA